MNRIDLEIEARNLAREGLGWENILVKLRDRGLTRFQARVAVFGAGVARKMEIRDATRARGDREVA